LRSTRTETHPTCWFLVRWFQSCDKVIHAECFLVIRWFRSTRQVGLAAERSAQVVAQRAAAAFFGALAAGAIAVVVNETLRPRQIEHVLSHARARCLITTGELLARQPRRLSTDARPRQTEFGPLVGHE